MSSLPLEIILAEGDNNSIAILVHCKMKCHVDLSIKTHNNASFVDSTIRNAKYSGSTLSFDVLSPSYATEHINFLSKPKIESLSYNVSFTLSQVVKGTGGRDCVILLSSKDIDNNQSIYDFRFLPEGYSVVSMLCKVVSDKELQEVSSTFGLSLIGGNNITIKKRIDGAVDHCIRIKGLLKEDIRYFEFIMSCAYDGKVSMTEKEVENTYKTVCPGCRKYSTTAIKPIRCVVLPPECEFILKQPHTLSGQIVTLTPPSHEVQIKFRKEELRDIILLF